MGGVNSVEIKCWFPYNITAHLYKQECFFSFMLRSQLDYFYLLSVIFQQRSCLKWEKPLALFGIPSRMRSTAYPPEFSMELIHLEL